MEDEKKQEKEEKIVCFAFRGFKCDALYTHVPRECEGCSFKKPDREVTNGVRYPYINYGSK